MDNTDIINKLKSTLPELGSIDDNEARSALKTIITVIKKLQPEPYFYQAGDWVKFKYKVSINEYKVSAGFLKENPRIETSSWWDIVSDDEKIIGVPLENIICKLIEQKPGQEFLEVIPHDGGEYSGDDNDHVIAWYRDGGLTFCKARHLGWGHFDSNSDVVKYVILSKGGE